MREQTIGSISDFMSGEWKVKKKRNYRNVFRAAPLLPLATVPTLSSYAQTPAAVPAVANGIDWPSLIHALDPVFDLLIALSYPVCGLVLVGSFFWLAFGNEEKCWSGVSRASLSFILIQMSPILLKVLEQIGKAV